ncbi:glycogen debranching enzyme family protein [Candidatus Dojkabacteria bacterium]|uniref:Glycogen debranching enzyme family protein n=1 Tax=Candidatus Dojkabacteria bacterium TaxID=2099670 RepID=A0A955L822_9BACT|nr:glycogen debranching enzyme family protein [Candidatus Dojkabacteria bacterium]
MQDEFLHTNSLGAYASSTFHSGNTRKYHGLLVASSPNIERSVIVSQVEEHVQIGEDHTPLSTICYKDTICSPDVSQCIENVIRAPYPTIEYDIEGLTISKQIKLAKDKNTVSVIYAIDTHQEIALHLKPFVTNRNFHSLQRFSDEKPYGVSISQNECTIEYSETQHLIIRVSGHTNFTDLACVYRDFEYTEELARGYDAHEDLFAPVGINAIFGEGSHTLVVTYAYIDTGIATGDQNFNTPIEFTPITTDYVEDALVQLNSLLSREAESFLVKSPTRTSIIAGYHWFEDWGRDTFISFRGLLLTQKKYDEAKEMLLTWAEYMKDGLIPNRPGLDEYNSIDATLWYIVSIYNYWIETQDETTIKTLLPTIAQSVEQLITGTRYNIMMEPTGILHAGDGNHGLTWMDAVVHGTPITPRSGAPVEIQMLWFNALNAFRVFEEKYGDQSVLYYINLILSNLKKSFRSLYWNSSTEYLVDYLTPTYKNIQIRPNPVIGLSLPFELLNPTLSKQVLSVIEKELYTPIGLKTLRSTDPQYQRTYSGSQEERDSAYHQGTVWPWLLGLYLKSYLIVHEHSKEAKIYVKEKLVAFWDELEKQELSYIPEVFSAETLKPNGCLSQAWNYATLLEVLHELELK